MSNQDKSTKPIRDTWQQIGNTIKAAYNLAPAIVISTVFLLVFTGGFFFTHMEFTLGVALVLIVFSSVIVYSQTGDYGQSSLALVAGLLGVFAISWTAETSGVFLVAWVVFTLLILLLASIKIAARTEQIRVEAAISISPSNVKHVEKELKRILKPNQAARLGPVERAEVIRVFAFRKLPIQNMEDGLDAVGKFATITRIDHQTLANFAADIYKMFLLDQAIDYKGLLAIVYFRMRSSPVSPQMFIEAFNNSRRIVLSGDLNSEIYFERLGEALSKGWLPDEVYEYIAK